MNPPLPPLPAKKALELRNLSVFLRASSNGAQCEPQHRRTQGHRFHRPFGRGKSTLLRTLNACTACIRVKRARARSNLWPGHPGRQQDINLLRARIGMVFQKPTPFPMSITTTSPLA